MSGFRRATSGLTCCIVFVLGAVAFVPPAVGAPPVAHAPKLDPDVMRALETGITGAMHAPNPTGLAKVLLELDAPVTEASLDALQQLGVVLTRVGSRRLAYDRFVPAVVDSASVARLMATPSVRRISAVVDAGIPPLDQSAKIIRLADARGAHPELGGLNGKGILIADIDTMVDPFHPSLFKGDGGYFDWIDVNGDGVFTPGTDAIDLDRDGKAGPQETAIVLSATTIDQRGKVLDTARPAGFDPGIDWLFLDTNGNGARDYGKAAGFDDAAPALGEPLFVPDDANRNAKLDVGERVVRLSTSKIRKIFVSLTDPVGASDLYERGKNLSETVVDYTQSRAYGYPDALHATCVSSILVGDVPLAGRRWVGLAPEADVIVSWDLGQGLPVDGVTWALAEKPDVMLHELSAWSGVALDGSDPLASLIDASVVNDNVTQTCPTGDQGSARKHTRAMVAAGATVQLPFDLPQHPIFSTATISYVSLSVHSRGGVPKGISLVRPDGQVKDMLITTPATLNPGANYYVTTQMTSRGTSLTNIVLYLDTSAGALQTGTWKLTVDGDPANAITVDGFFSDNVSSFGVGVAWDAAIATDASTIGVPSTADHCIAINAQPDHLGSPQAPWFNFQYAGYDVPTGYTDKDGQIRAYTPRGPRIDGAVKPDVTAPDNPWAAAQHSKDTVYPYGSFRVFGGTSGASPHVTGVAALLASVGIRGDKARDALRAGAATDATTGTVPNGDYGFGRLDAAGALGIKSVGKDFSIMLSSDPARPIVGSEAKLVVTAQGDADAIAGLEVEWDDGYDGTWDAPFASTTTHPIAAMTAGNLPFKVRARNASGHIAEAVLWVDFDEKSGCGCHLGGRPLGMPFTSGTMLGLLLAGLVAWRVRRRAT